MKIHLFTGFNTNPPQDVINISDVRALAGEVDFDVKCLPAIPTKRGLGSVHSARMPVPLRLLYGLNIDGRPKRVSMFPPSYADRAREREAIRHQNRTGVTADRNESLSPLGSPRPPMPGMPPPDFSTSSTSPTKRLGREVIIKKDRLVIPRGKKISVHSGNGRNVSKSTNGYGSFVVDEGRRKSVSAQTDVTFCTHECENHPKTIDLVPPAEPDKAKRKGLKGQKEAKQWNEEGQKVEKKEKHKKGSYDSHFWSFKLTAGREREVRKGREQSFGYGIRLRGLAI
jgi:hypothetical protein